jgi:hypothetical protein
MAIVNFDHLYKLCACSSPIMQAFIKFVAISFFDNKNLCEAPNN